MKRYICFLMALQVMLYSSCVFTGDRVMGNGQKKTELRDQSNFSKIKSTGSINVEIHEGAHSVQVSADENLMQYIVTDTNDGWLEIHFKDHVNVKSDNPITVIVTAPQFEAITVTGSGTVSSVGKIRSTSEMDLRTTGSGNINIALNAPVVNAEVTGSGNMEITGETRKVEIKVTGSGQYVGDRLMAEDVQALVTGSGDAMVFADDKLDAKVTGSGTIKYAGKADVKMNILGSGRVSKIEE